MGRHETLLKEAAAAGLEVRIENHRVVVEGPDEAESLAMCLIDRPHEVALELEQEALALVDERAAIIEYDGGLDRMKAEKLALDSMMHFAARLLGSTPGDAAHLLRGYMITRNRRQKTA